MKKTVWWIVCILFAATISHSAVIRVPADQPTIQEALNAAGSGDTVLVSPGIYTESLQWPSLEKLILQGDIPDDRAIIEPPLHYRCLTYDPDVTGSELIISNIIFRNGRSAYSGGALFISNSIIHIKNCNIDSNYANHRGGGMFFTACDVELSDSVISGCHSNREGGGACFISCNLNITDTKVEQNNTDNERDGLGLYLYDCTGVIRNSIIQDHSNWYMNGAGIFSTGCVNVIGCLFERNAQYGSDYISGALHTGGNCLIQDNVFIDNFGWGAAIKADGDGVNITNNLFIRNTGHYSYSGSIWIQGSSTIVFNTFVDSLNSAITVAWTSQPVISNCIFSGNGKAINNFNNSGGATCDYNAFFNNGADYDGIDPGLNDLFDRDPLFVTGPLGDYYLSQTAAGQPATSPCVDAGDPLATVPCGTTRTDQVPDDPPPDTGFHYPYSSDPPPTFTPTLSPTPEPTSTPACDWLGAKLEMSQLHLYRSGDTFWLECQVCVDTKMSDIPTVILLGVYGEFWFWPAWTQEFDHSIMTFDPGLTVFYGIDPFTWPTVEGHVTGLEFFAALLTPSMTDIIGGFGNFVFGYTDR